MDESEEGTGVTTPTVARHQLLRPDADGYDEIDGRLLGFATSRRDYHNHPVPRDFETHGENWKCSACRWFEVTIIYVPQDETYALYTVGHSSLPGEGPRPRVQFTESPHELIELLTDRRGSRPRLPVAAARCLAQAASNDENVSDAYVNRAVV